MHRRRLKSHSSVSCYPTFEWTGYSQVVSDSAILQFRSAFGFVHTPGIFDTDAAGVHSPPWFDRFSIESHLESCLVVPVWVDLGQLAGDPVVLPHKERVHHCQDLEGGE